MKRKIVYSLYGSHIRSAIQFYVLSDINFNLKLEANIKAGLLIPPSLRLDIFVYLFIKKSAGQ